MAKIKEHLNSGFTLLEMMLALTVFSVFLTAFLTSQGGNLTDSINMEEETILHNLCLNKINELIIDHPKLTESLTLSKETKSFEEKGFENYQYTIEYKKLEIPVEAMMGGGDDENADAPEQNAANKLFQDKIMKQFKENMERLIWQLVVTVENKETGFSYSLSTWLDNPEAPIKVSL